MKTLKVGDLIKVFTICGLETGREYAIIAVYSDFAVGENNGKHIPYVLHYSGNEAELVMGNDGNKHVVKTRYPRLR